MIRRNTIMEEMRELIKGAYDMHVHSAPDVLPRKMNDLEMARRIKDAGMAGYVIKSHYFCTSERGELIREQYPECDAIGAVTLNRAVGGINPVAVEMAARSGARLVWMPTCDAAHERAHVFSGDPNKKLPYWAQILIQLEKDGVNTPVISILENGKLTDETYDLLDTIAKHDLILATGHISHEETFALVKAAKERGVQRILITHVDFPTTFYTIEEQKELLSYGAYMEHCYTTFATGKVDFNTTLEQIRAIGPSRVVLATDLGQKTALYPDEGLLEFATKLYENGFSAEEVRQMTVKNPTELLRG